MIVVAVGDFLNNIGLFGEGELFALVVPDQHVGEDDYVFLFEAGFLAVLAPKGDWDGARLI